MRNGRQNDLSSLCGQHISSLNAGFDKSLILNVIKSEGIIPKATERKDALDQAFAHTTRQPDGATRGDKLMWCRNRAKVLFDTHYLDHRLSILMAGRWHHSPPDIQGNDWIWTWGATVKLKPASDDSAG